MMRFNKVDDGAAITRSRGIYRQVDIYEREGKLYAKHGAGLVRLYKGGGTSNKDIKWSDIDPGDGSYEETGNAVVFLPPVREAAE